MTFEHVQRTARQLANTLGELRELGVKDRAVYNTVLRSVLEANDDFAGVWCVWEPDGLDGKDRRYVGKEGHDHSGRFIPLWKRSRQGKIALEANTNYDQPGPGDYYLIPLSRGAEWTFEPYDYYPAAGGRVVLASQVAPLFHGSSCVGVAGVDLWPETLQALWRQRDASRATVKPVEAASAEHKLSRREREVWAWLAQGKTNPEIATILGISPHTVKNHLEKVFRKLGVENRLAAGLQALRGAPVDGIGRPSYMPQHQGRLT